MEFYSASAPCIWSARSKVRLGEERMINYEEELKKFKPVQEAADVEGTVYSRDMTDMMDLMKEILKETNPGVRRK